MAIRMVVLATLSASVLSGCLLMSDSGPSQNKLETERYRQACQEDSRRAYDEYLRRYPQGRYASKCRERIEAIETEKKAEIQQRELFNQTRLRILQGYSVNKTTEKDFFLGKWTASDPLRGRLGIVSWNKLNGANRYTIGYIDPGLDLDPSCGSFVQDIYEGAMDAEKHKCEGLRLRTVSPPVLPSVGVEYRGEDD